MRKPEHQSARGRALHAAGAVQGKLPLIRMTPAATYREQTVELTLGPKGAFENGNVSILTRRVPAKLVVRAVPPNRGKPKEPKTPRVVELLRKALEWQAILESGKASNQAEIAGRDGITRARVTQVMGLLRLAPEIQEFILSMAEVVGRPSVTERALRPICRLTSWSCPGFVPLGLSVKPTSLEPHRAQVTQL